jgi:hypothetical protein
VAQSEHGKKLAAFNRAAASIPDPHAQRRKEIEFKIMSG